MIRIGIIAIAFATALSAAARSETVTLVCKLASHVDTGPPDTANKYFRVDQIFIDTDKPAFELRVANTVGTAHEEVYSHVDLGDPCRKPQIQVRGDTISGSQQCGAPIGFFYFKGLHQFMLSQLYVGRGEIFVWDCL
ncbi:MAG: hypothetical protein WAV18_17005 [Roseiarcus sp.]